jgi:hypothetical protein
MAHNWLLRSGRIALLLVCAAQAEGVSQLERVAWNPISMINRKEVFRREIGIEVPSYACVG